MPKEERDVKIFVVENDLYDPKHAMQQQSVTEICPS